MLSNLMCLLNWLLGKLSKALCLSKRITLYINDFIWTMKKHNSMKFIWLIQQWDRRILFVLVIYNTICDLHLLLLLFVSRLLLDTYESILLFYKLRNLLVLCHNVNKHFWLFLLKSDKLIFPYPQANERCPAWTSCSERNFIFSYQKH